jgi:hypothetical protein
LQDPSVYLIRVRPFPSPEGREFETSGRTVLCKSQIAFEIYTKSWKTIANSGFDVEYPFSKTHSHHQNMSSVIKPVVS